MYLMNKVRALPQGTFYEVIKYDIEQSNKLTVMTLNRQDLNEVLKSPYKDFREENGYLISVAERSNTSLFEEPEFPILIGKSIFHLLCELCIKGAFFIPQKLFNEGRDYKGEEISNFYNIRVSSSSMYIGFSLVHDNSWFSSKIIYIEDDVLKTKPFYIALPDNQVLENCELELVSLAKVNGKTCKIFRYDNELPIIPEFTPVAYLPLPLFNYLNLHFCRLKNAVNFFYDILNSKGIASSSRDYIPTAPLHAITVEPSVKPSSKQRRFELMHYYTHFSGTLDEFNELYNLNILERYTFILLDKVKALKDTDELFNLVKKLRIERSLYSLLLMMFRCQVFKDPFIFPQYQNRIIARGGGGGDFFYTYIGQNNY